MEHWTFGAVMFAIIIFIEKADKFINSFFHPDDTELKKGILDEFHKYMKGEKV